MTKDDLIENEPRSYPILAQILFYIGVCLFGGGATAGVTIGLRDGIDATLLIITGVFFAIGLGAIAIAVRIGNFEPPSLKTRAGQTQLILIASVILGLLIAFYLSLTDAFERITSGTYTMTPAEGAVALLLLFGVMLPICVVWSRRIDEHEARAAKDAAYIGLYAYMFLYLGWVIAATAQWAPPVDDLAVYLIVNFVFVGVWVVKRSG